MQKEEMMELANKNPGLAMKLFLVTVNLMPHPEGQAHSLLKKWLEVMMKMMKRVGTIPAIDI